MKPACTYGINIHNSKKGKDYSVKFVIVNEDLTSLLGLQATEKIHLLSIHRDNFKVVNNVRFTSKDDIIAKYPDLFDEKLGNLEGDIHFHVNPEANPVMLPCRSVRISVGGKLITELDRLVDRLWHQLISQLNELASL